MSRIDAESAQRGSLLLKLGADRALMAAGVLFLACALATALGLTGLGQFQARNTEEIAATRALRADAAELLQAATEAESDQRALLLTGEDAYRTSYETAREEARAHLAALSTGDASLAGYAEAAHKAGASLEAAFRTLDAAAEARGPARTAALAEASAAWKVMRADVVALARIIDARVAQLRGRALAARSTLYWISSALALLTMAAAVFAFFVVRAERRAAVRHMAALTVAKHEADEARASATESDRAKSRFLSAASHDMRQPLQALGLYINALKRRVTTDEARDIVGRIDSAAGSLSGMFTALFDIARLQGEHVDVEMEAFALEPVIARIAGEFEDDAFSLPEGATSVTSDRALFERLMRNLMSNAVRHGGGKAQIRVAHENGRAVVSVADQGPGIAAEDHERIFEEFQRLDERTKAESLGLGLSIVRRVAQLIGAEIALESAPGKGARFSVSLPLAASVARTPDAPVKDSALVGLRVATMDDDPLVLEAMAQMLRDAGAEVRAAANEHGLRSLFADGWKPHAIVTDFRIDGVLSGADAARAASAALTPSPGILVVTGDTAPETMETLRGLGVAWMVKPVAPDALTRAVRELIASET